MILEVKKKITTTFNIMQTCELSCSEDNLKVDTIFLERALASENPNENSMISAIIA